MFKFFAIKLFKTKFSFDGTLFASLNLKYVPLSVIFYNSILLIQFIQKVEINMYAKGVKDTYYTFEKGKITEKN